MPTPVRNPTSTVRERKSARNPSFKIRASSRNPAVNSAAMPTRAMYFSLKAGAIVESELEKMAAVAESAATTRWREEPKAANATNGNSTV
jgi:DnaJ-domain-containing protein 1